MLAHPEADLPYVREVMCALPGDHLIAISDRDVVEVITASVGPPVPGRAVPDMTIVIPQLEVTGEAGPTGPGLDVPGDAAPVEVLNAEIALALGGAGRGNGDSYRRRRRK